MSKADKEALAFGVLLFVILIGGMTLGALKEHWRNTSCAALGGVVVDLKCGRFEPVSGWTP